MKAPVLLRKAPLLKGGRLPLSGGDGRRPEGVGEATKWRGDSVYRQSVGRDNPGAPFSGDEGLQNL